MASEIKVKNLKWSDIQLICPCGGNKESGMNHFNLIQQGGQVVFKCSNPGCHNIFPDEVQLKVLQDVEKWVDKNGTIDGFTTNFFRTLIIPKKTKGGLDCYSKEKCKMRARYIETKTVGKKDPKQFYVIEVSNITILENENILNYQYVPTQQAEDIPKQ